MGMARKRYLPMIVLVAFQLGACSQRESERMRLAGWISSPFESDAMYSIVERYNAQNPSVDVVYQPIQANYIEKIQLMLGTDTAPDVFMLESFWAPTLINYETLLPLDDLIDSDTDFDLEDFEPNLLEAFRKDGKLYGVPKDFSTVGLFYNPDLFAEAGIVSAPASWEELAHAARRLTKDTNGDGVTDVFGLGVVDSVEFVLPFIWQNGGEIVSEDGGIDYDNEHTIEAIRFLKQLRDEGVAVVPTDVGASWNMEALGRKRVAMTISGLWAVNFMDSTFAGTQYEIAGIPVGVRRESIAYVVGYVIPASTKYPQDAWRLLRYLTSREGQAEWAALKLGLPPRRSVVDAAGLRDDPRQATFIEASSYARTWQLGPNQRLMDELQTAMQAIFLTDAPIEHALMRANERL